MFAACAALALFGLGCSRSLENRPKDVQVVIEGPGGFPLEMAGRWKADGPGWELVFAPDGRVLSAVLDFGQVEVVPGRTTTIPTKSGGKGVFTPGAWTVHYLPATRQLTVRIVMAHVRVEMAGNAIEGASTDVFVGPVEGAAGVWETQWTTFTRYKARTASRTSVDLSTEGLDGQTQPVTFRKTAD
ncbi:MAG: hypothetical protein A2Y77_09470 [Planctomycetes bacterium RBG_13_62_9]|nr:MAG: hypothetical protein A2Y77_09470 [Planctomycetes bacterium RBG_13_62_9]